LRDNLRKLGLVETQNLQIKECANIQIFRSVGKVVLPPAAPFDVLFGRRSTLPRAARKPRSPTGLTEARGRRDALSRVRASGLKTLGLTDLELPS
jgi:hypothetical protein